MAKKRITVNQLKEMLTEPGFSGIPSDLIVCRAEPIEVANSESPDQESLVRTFIASTGNPDREGDRIAVDGWELENYRKGGSVLYGHDSHSTPAHVVGKPLATWVEQGVLKNRIEFTPKEINPTGYMVYRLVSGGFLRSSSVGFLPLEWKEVSDRPGYMPVDFIKQELLEHSVVPVPANPEALDEAKAMGIDLKPMVEWTEKILDEKTELLLVTRDLVEGAWKIARAAVSVQVPAVKKEPPQPQPTDNGEDKDGLVVTKPGFEDADGEIKYRVREPGDFEPDSFRRIEIQKEKPRVFGIIGKLKGEDNTTLQALRFPKEDDWTIDEARKWVADHPDAVKSICTDKQLPEYVWTCSADVGKEQELDIAACVKMANEAMSKAISRVTTLTDKLIDSISTIGDALGKSGRVLSSANEDKLRQARDMLSAVISQVENQPEPPKSVEPEAKSAPEQPKSNGGLDLSDPRITRVISELVGDLFDKQIKRLRGEPED